MQILHKEQLLNVITVDSALGMYLTIENNSIWIIDSQYQVYKRILANYDLCCNYKNQKYWEGQICVFQPQLYQAVLNNGQIYIQCFEKIYCLSANLQLELICEIPNINLNNPYSFMHRLFSLNNELFVHNNEKPLNQGSIYKLVNGQLEKVAEMCGKFVQCNEKVFVVDLIYNQAVSQLQNDFTLVEVFKIEKACGISFAHNGIIIFNSPEGELVQIIDLVNNKQYFIQDDDLLINNVINSLSLGPFGLQLNMNKQDNYFENDDIVKITDSCNQYLSQQMNFQTFKDLKQHVLSFNVLMRYHYLQVNDKLLYYHRYCNAIERNAQKIGGILQVSQKINNILVNRFTEYFDIENYGQ
ncbi:Conserved_hypothetical protein [Hexamita inflata]|uniref:Uncharacterized protein n=2 Tax=Hexamita inflata TaxID=28002 RepID=A0AA86R0F0_9EUKA|nr:Conserved hypothetical protein [Hexamita inflata]